MAVAVTLSATSHRLPTDGVAAVGVVVVLHLAVTTAADDVTRSSGRLDRTGVAANC